MILKEHFNEFSTEYSRFDHVKNKLSDKPDVHALMLLDKLILGGQCIIKEAKSHYIIFDINVNNLMEVITDEQVRDLRRCKVFYYIPGDVLIMNID